MKVGELFKPAVDLLAPPVPSRIPEGWHGLAREIMNEWTRAGRKWNADDLGDEVAARLWRARSRIQPPPDME
jgi:hypothetical protein